VKYVQAVSLFHKFMSRGVRCHTRRTSEFDVASGWQLDTKDPITSLDFAGEVLTAIGIDANDSPGVPLTWFTDYEFKEVLYVDDRFEMYLVYYSGNDPHSPPIQRVLGKYAWNYGGLVVFDHDDINGGQHRIRFRNPVLQSPPSSFPLQTYSNPEEGACPGSTLSDNKSDSARELVKYYYLDILKRNPDTIGWNNWTVNIAQCIFDWNCLRVARPNVGVQFLWSYEFRNRIADVDPKMAAGPDGTSEYNRRFVYWCYKTLLDREPDYDGYNNWVNTLNATGDYNAVVFGFIYSNDYRNRSRPQ